MKHAVRKWMPPKLLRAARKAKDSIALPLLAWTDLRTFAKHYSRDADMHEKRNLQARLIFFAHSIEKGLSHRNIRYGFGESAIGALVSVIDLYSGQGYPKDEKAYQMALSTLREYFEVHEAQNISETPLSAAPEWLQDELRKCSTELGGSTELNRTSAAPSAVEGFNIVVFGRRSVREYDSRPVPAEKLDEAIRVASRAPSVCNRQSIRVRVIRDSDLIKKLLDIQSGFRGYAPPPVLLVITADVRNYLSSNERNQPYVDGGLFTMGLLLGLEAADLAACALHAMFSISHERQLRAALEIDEAEVLITFIAVGTFPSSYKVAKSFRYDVAELVR